MEIVPQTTPPFRTRSRVPAPVPTSKKRKSAAMNTTTRQPLQRITGWARPSRSRALIPSDPLLRQRSIVSPDSGGNEARLSKRGDRESGVRFRSERSGVVHSTGSEISSIMHEPLSPPMTPHAATSGSVDALEEELMRMDMREFLTVAPEELYQPFDTPGVSRYHQATVESGDEEEDSGMETVVGDTGLAIVEETVRAPSPPPARPGPARARRRREVRGEENVRRRRGLVDDAYGREEQARRGDGRRSPANEAGPPRSEPPEYTAHASHERLSPPAPSKSNPGHSPVNTFPHLSNTLLRHLRDRLDVLEAHLDQVDVHIAHEQNRRPTLQEPDFLPQLYARREDMLWRAEGVFVRYADVCKGAKALREMGEESVMNEQRQVEDHGWIVSLMDMLGLNDHSVQDLPARQSVWTRLRPQHFLLAGLMLSLITSLVWRVGIVLAIVVVVYGGPRMRPFVLAGRQRLSESVNAFVASVKIGWNDVSKLNVVWPGAGIRGRWKGKLW